MEAVNFVLGGLGGQGILFMTKVLAQCAVDKGISVMGAETHGMAQRGGSVVSHLRLGCVRSSLIEPGSAHFVLALEENEAYRNLGFLANRARLYANSRGNHFPRAEVKDFLRKREILCRSVPAGKIAMEMRVPMASNLALIGYFSAFGEGPMSGEDLRSTIGRISPDRFREMNFRVFDAAYKIGAKEVAGAQ